MTGYRGGNSVRGGLYWCPSKWQIVSLPKKGGVLPGEAHTRYIRVPLVTVLLLGPIMGALFVVFLPIIGFALVFGFGGVKLFGAMRKALANAPVHPEAEAVAEEAK